MRFLKYAGLVGFSVIAAAAYSQNSEQYLEKETLAMQKWGHQVTEQVSASLQKQMVEDIEIEYEYKLAQHESETTEHLALIAGINSETEVSIKKEQMVAQLVSEQDEDCKN